MDIIFLIFLPIIIAVGFGILRKYSKTSILLACSCSCWAALFYGIRHLGSWFGGADIGFGLIVMFSPMITIPSVFIIYYLSRSWSESKKIIFSILFLGLWVLLSFGYNYSIHLAEREYKRKSKIDCEKLPYHCAVVNNNLAILDSLKEKNVSIELKDGFGHTALVRSMHDDVAAKKLLELGADPNTLSGDGMIVLFYALLLQNEPKFEVAQHLILHGARVNDLFSVYGDKKKMTILNYAITQGKVDVVEFLFKNGSDPLQRDEYGYNGCERIKMYQNQFKYKIVHEKCDKIL